MSGYRTYLRLQRIEENAKKLGFRLGDPRNGSWDSSHGIELVSLFPNDNSLPIYGPNAEIFCGSFHDVEVFLTGWAKSQEYDMMLRMSNSDKRKKYEDKERERQLLEKERIEKKKMFAILANKTEAAVEKLI